MRHPSAVPRIAAAALIVVQTFRPIGPETSRVHFCRSPDSLSCSTLLTCRHVVTYEALRRAE